MLGSIYVGLSGLEAYSKGLQTISNNVANLNTLGFKATTVSFNDVFSEGSARLSFSEDSSKARDGNGVRFGAGLVDFGQGELRQSDGDLDLAVNGNGFLTLLDGDQASYARTGQFTRDKDGFITLSGTEKHLAILGEGGRPEAVNLNAYLTNLAEETKTVTFGGNLAQSGTTATPVIVSGIATYGPDGTKHTLALTFTKTATAGEWTVGITDSSGHTFPSSTLRFNGQIIDPTTAQLTVTDQQDASFSLKLDFSDVTASQSAPNTVATRTIDGHGGGTLQTVTVDEDGQLKLSYSNEQTKLLGPVALADFRDTQQLERAGNGLFNADKAGLPRLLASGVDGMGKLVSKQLEASNVDLSKEFGDLILVQRGYQASSQVISVTNDMIQQLFGIRGQG